MTARGPGSQRQALRLVRVAIGAVALFAACSTAWIAFHATRNPDVRARRPDWLDASHGDAGYWIPLLLTVAVGAVLVVAVLTRAARRLSAGADLYAEDRALGRSGEGERNGDRSEPTN